MRLFIALELQRVTRQILEGVCGNFQRTVTGVRWVKPEKMHLTLAFLNEQPRPALGPIVECMEQAVRGVTPFSLTIAGLGAFPNTRRPRIIWAGVELPNEPLETLNRQLKEALTAHDLPTERRAFRPHITIGRVRSTKKRGFQGLRDVLQHTTFEPASNPVRQLTLFESVLTREGAHYRVVEEVSL